MGLLPFGEGITIRNLHKVEIEAKQHPGMTTLKVDGQPLRGVISFRVEQSVDSICVVTLQMMAEASVDGECVFAHEIGEKVCTCGYDGVHGGHNPDCASVAE